MFRLLTRCYSTTVGKTVVVGMSGGVDSSVSAYLLKKQGFNVIGCYMKNWDPSDEMDGKRCTTDHDMHDAERVCEQLDIPFRTVSFVESYWERVFSQVLDAYESGITPNPDVLCNRYIKFDAFYNHAINILGADYFATGHYARIESSIPGYKPFETVLLSDNDIVQLPTIYTGEEPPLLCSPNDARKDQTYFLALVKEGPFRKTLFPLSYLEKSKVREIAERLNLHTATKKDSVGICFIGKRNFPEFISDYIEQKPGKFVTVDGEEIKGVEHTGISTYTLGQSARIGGLPVRMYVCDKNIERNEIIVCDSWSHPALFKNEAIVDNVSWVSDQPPNELMNLKENDDMICSFKANYNSPLQRGKIRFYNNKNDDDNNNDNKLLVQFDQPRRAVAPGQTLVIYQEDNINQRRICLGGGIIQ